jgi:hypothetical protein
MIKLQSQPNLGGYLESHHTLLKMEKLDSWIFCNAHERIRGRIKQSSYGKKKAKLYYYNDNFHLSRTPDKMSEVLHHKESEFSVYCTAIYRGNYLRHIGISL